MPSGSARSGIACCGLLLALQLVACREEPVTVRSAIVIVVDSLRADHLGMYGYRRPVTPKLDAWSERGAVFDRALAASPWTLPSMGSILTGRIPSRHLAGKREEGRVARHLRECTGDDCLRAPQASPWLPLDSSVSTLPEILQAQGFATAACVNNPFLAPRFGLSRGFDKYDYKRTTNHRLRRADIVVRNALLWLNQRADERFFLFVHVFDPHAAYDPPESVRRTFTSEEASFEYPALANADIRLGVHLPDAAERTFIIGAYDEEVLFVDLALDRFLRALEARGVFEDTLVVLTSDHGEEFYDHGGFEHGHTVYQELLMVPLVVWGPGVRPERIREPVSHLDLLPTLLEALGLPIPAGGEGVSLWPALTRGDRIEPHTIVSEGTLYGIERKVLLAWPWKLELAKRPGGDHARLFDLENDRHEHRDRALDFPGRRDELLMKLTTLTERAASESSPEPAVDLDVETTDALRALGYLE